MRYFKAQAHNENGYTFQFRFAAVNWNGIEEVARAKLDELIAADKLHQQNAPWNFRNIDVTG